MRVHIRLGSDIEVECEDSDYKTCMDATYNLIEIAMDKRNQLIVTEQAINSVADGDMALKPLISTQGSHIAPITVLDGYN